MNDYRRGGGAPMATDKQLAYIDSLAARHLLEGWQSSFHQDIRDGYPVTRGVASRFIEALQGQPERAPRRALPKVPPGYYATKDALGHVALWKVERKGGAGKHAGTLAVRRVTLQNEAARITATAQRRVLNDIAAMGFSEAAALYGTTSLRCARYGCNQPLKDDASKARGYGPNCWAFVTGEDAQQALPV